jgi:glycosyltransferase involved in cell wall biosynthesis
VSASSWESFGISVLEAMFCGKAIIAPNVGGIPSLIENEVSGLLLEDYSPASLASSIMRLLNDSDLKMSLGNEAMQRSIVYYTIDRMLDDYESLYGQLVE